MCAVRLLEDRGPVQGECFGGVPCAVTQCLCCDLSISWKQVFAREQPISFFRGCLRLYKEISKLYSLKYLWDL